MQSTISETKRAAIERALQHAFDTTTVESIVPMTGGWSSARVYRIVVSGIPYVLRIIMEIDPLSDPAHLPCIALRTLA